MSGGSSTWEMHTSAANFPAGMPRSTLFCKSSAANTKNAIWVARTCSSGRRSGARTVNTRSPREPSPVNGCRPRRLQVRFHLRHHVRVLLGDILRLAQVRLEVVEFRLRIRGVGLAQVLPVAAPHGLLEAALVEFPVEEFVRLLRPAGQRRHHR